LTLTRAMELFDITAGRVSDEAEILSRVQIPVLVVGIDSDILYQPQEVRQFASCFPRGVYRELVSPCGHDSFIVDTAALSVIVKDFIHNELSFSN
jgi:homoserine O-acetyltransferase